MLIIAAGAVVSRLAERRQNMIQSAIFEQRLREYINRSHLAESSEQVLERAVRWFCEQHREISPAQVEYGHIDDYRSWLRKGRAATTANTYLAMIKGFFGWMLSRQYIRSDPFESVKRYAIAERQFEQYTTEEVRRILKVAKLRWRAIICLALCSMRRAEILNLHVSDIDFERNEIHIRPKVKSETTWPWSIKNHNEALVGIDDTVARMLMQLTDQLEDSRQPYLILKAKYWRRNLERQQQGKLSCYLRNCPWGNFTRDFRALLRCARVKPKRFHDLRGTFATERYRDGFELVDLQYLMRHASIQTTVRYVKRIEQKKLIEKSGRAFKKYYATSVS